MRVGSRSKNEVLEPCMLKNRRMRRSGALHLSNLEFRGKKDRFVVSEITYYMSTFSLLMSSMAEPTKVSARISEYLIGETPKLEY